MLVLSFPKHGRRAFTFIEFVMIVATLVILAAIILPVKHRPRPDARRSSCQSNLKLIGLGMKLYLEDFNERYPLVRHEDKRSTGWAANLQPYFKNTQTYQCPSEINKESANPASWNYSDYFYNSNLSSPRRGRKAADLVAPAFTIIIGDAESFSSSNSSNGGTVTALEPFAVNGDEVGLAVAQGRWDPAIAGVRHREGGNYGFADGHVKWLKPELVTREPTSAGKFTFRWSAKNPPVSGS